MDLRTLSPKFLPFVVWLYGDHTHWWMAFVAHLQQSAPACDQVRTLSPPSSRLRYRDPCRTLEKAGAIATCHILVFHDDVSLHGSPETLAILDSLSMASTQLLSFSGPHVRCNSSHSAASQTHSPRTLGVSVLKSRQAWCTTWKNRALTNMRHWLMAAWPSRTMIFHSTQRGPMPIHSLQA
jgi:hypothetical protein